MDKKVAQKHEDCPHLVFVRIDFFKSTCEAFHPVRLHKIVVLLLLDRKHKIIFLGPIFLHFWEYFKDFNALNRVQIFHSNSDWPQQPFKECKWNGDCSCAFGAFIIPKPTIARYGTRICTHFAWSFLALDARIELIVYKI